MSHTVAFKYMGHYISTKATEVEAESRNAQFILHQKWKLHHVQHGWLHITVCYILCSEVKYLYVE